MSNRIAVVIPVNANHRLQKDMIGQTRDEVKKTYFSQRQVLLDQEIAVGRIKLYHGFLTKLPQV